MTVSLAEKIAVVEEQIRSCRSRALHASYPAIRHEEQQLAALEAVLADLRAWEDQKVDSGALVQRVLRVLDNDVSGTSRRELAEEIVAGVVVLLAHQIGHPQRLADARRAGAERMRERMASHYGQFKPDDLWTTERIIADIRALPVE